MTNWTDLEPIAPNPGTGIVASIGKSKNGAAKLRLTLSARVLSEFKGLRPESKFRLQRGDERFRLRLSLDPGGKFTAKGGLHGSARFMVPLFADLPEHGERAYCEWHRDGETALIIILPLSKWLEAPPKTAPAALPPAGRPPSRVVDMGDPPPGRSALDQKRGGR